MNNILDPNLVLYLPLYRPDGSSPVSRDAYGHSVTVTGAIWTPRGRSFDGVDDIITVPDHPRLDGMNQLSVFIWLCLNELASTRGENAQILNKSHPTSPWQAYYLVNFTTDTLRFSVREQASGLETYGTVNVDSSYTGRWLLITGVYDGDRTSMFIDGELASQGNPQPGTVYNSDSTLRIGAWTSSSQRLNGTIGEIAIYNRGCTRQEIENHYLATKWRYR